MTCFGFFHGKHGGAVGCIAVTHRLLSSGYCLISLYPCGFSPGYLLSSHLPKKHAGRWIGYAKSPLGESVCKCVRSLDWDLIQGYSCLMLTGIGSGSSMFLTRMTEKSWMNEGSFHTFKYVELFSQHCWYFITFYQWIQRNAQKRNGYISVTFFF